MISDELFIQQSLINNLFYLRTLREFSINLQLSFFENKQDYIDTARDFGKKFEQLGERAIMLAQNRLAPELLNSEIFITPYTLDTELLTEKLFGIDINTSLTEKEANLKSNNGNQISEEIINDITKLNSDAYVITQNFIDFIKTILDEMVKNETFSSSYPLFYRYAILESNLYLQDLDRLINKTSADPVYIAGFQYYYLQVMRCQTQFIAGLSDPEQTSIIDQAREFENEFETLMVQYNNSQISPEKILIFNENALEVAEKFKYFITSIIKRVLKAELYFIIEPIFLDNLLTKVNYFIYLLKGSNIGINKEK